LIRCWASSAAVSITSTLSFSSHERGHGHSRDDDRGHEPSNDLIAARQRLRCFTALGAEGLQLALQRMERRGADSLDVLLGARVAGRVDGWQHDVALRRAARE
jgi:hypothetical protein